MGCPVNFVWRLERDASVWFLRPFPIMPFLMSRMVCKKRDLIKFHATVERTRVEGIKTMASTGPDSVLGRGRQGEDWLLA